MSDPLVIVKQGALKGAIIENVDGGEFICFNGIPYAEPPIGDLRFKDPQPPKPWTGVRKALAEGGVAAQRSELTKEYIGGEDCLYLNVSTKTLIGKKAVMLWIHGGGFRSGFSNRDLYSPDYLVHHNIVFVSINYRLGMLGFLNMDTENCSGNQGLKDQVRALEWVQENIEAFGGDKNNVTIFGESAGAASVHYLCISPLAKGLFHKAIIQSGVAINPWAYQLSNKEFAVQIANALGNPESNPEEVLKFLRSVSAQELVQAVENVFQNYIRQLRFPFVPTPDIKSSNPFLPKPLSEMIEDGINVPVMIGYTSHEGILALWGSDSDDFYKEFSDEFEEHLSFDMKLDSSTAHQLSKTVRKFYFKNDHITKEDREQFIQLKSHELFHNGISYILEKQLQKETPTYFYNFSFKNEVSLIKLLINVDAEGAAHADDLTSLFNMNAFGPDKRLKKGTKAHSVMQQMTKMWTDFAKTGEPTPQDSKLINTKWFPYICDRKFCLNISDSLIPIEDFEEESWKLWKPVLDNHKPF